jgi:hypothetical protein
VFSVLGKLFTKAKTNHKVIVVTDLGHVRIMPVYSDHDGMLETATAMFPKDQAKTYYDEMTGGLVYTYQLTNDAFTEAQQLKHLQKQVVLGRIFNFDTKKGIADLKELLPYMIALFALMFK